MKEEKIMKKYYINYYRDFRNTYNLVYAEDGEVVPDGWERITRADALRMARSADDYGSRAIHPINYDGDIRNDRNYQLVGRIWERVC